MPLRLSALPGLVLPVLMLLSLPAVAQVGVQEHAAITRAAEQHARTLVAGQNLVDITVSAGPLDSRLRLAACGLPLETLSNPGALRGGRVTVGVRCTGAAPWTLYVPVRIEAQVAVVQLQGPLPRGTVLAAEHMKLTRVALATLPQHYFADPAQLLGQQLTRAIGTDTLATQSLVQVKDLVSKGQTVVILAQGERLAVRMDGVALQKGQLGERIPVRNSNSGRTVEAVVVDAATVQVQM